MDKVLKFFDGRPYIPIGIIAFLALLVLFKFFKARVRWIAPRVKTLLLDQVLFWWGAGNPFCIRDLMASVVIFGRTGSGKTSSSGRLIGKSIINNRKSGGLVILPKPEDIEMWLAWFKEAGRLNDVILFGPNNRNRTNFLGCLGSPRDTVSFLASLSEVGKRGGSNSGGENSRFYDQQRDRFIYDAVCILNAAKEPVTGPNLHRFIMTAATAREDLINKEWQSRYHNQLMERAFNAPKDPIQAHDVEIAMDSWLKEWACLMDPKTRGNILAGIQGTLSVLNSGIVREMCSGQMTCSPKDVVDGKWILVDFSPAEYGQAGLLISAGWKHLVELEILARRVTEDDSFCTIWADEAQQFVTEFDSHYIAQCRSHKGCLVYLTQSVSSLYGAMPGEAGKHLANALLANFSHTVIHPSDPETAKWAQSKLGRNQQMFFGGSSGNRDSSGWDQFMGRGAATASFNTHYEHVLQEQNFMIGRTGGPTSGYMCDAIVIRSGEPFATGENYIRAVFDQRG
jgi:hypothetical protein